MTTSRILLRIAVPLLAAAPIFAQNAISTRAGLVNVADGEVFLAGKAVQPKPSEIVQISAGSLLSTGEGRAEILLTPGSFLRMPDQSAFTLDRTNLEDVCLTLTEGTILIEVAELLEGNSITVRLKDAEARLAKTGLYRFTADPLGIRVYEGEAVVKTPAGEQKLKKSRQLTASANGWEIGKFDTDETDGLHRWSRRRSEYVAMANRSSARTASSFAGAWGGRSSGWLYNPFFGTMTFIPMYATAGSPFGFSYYTPFTVYRAYQPVYGGGGGSGASAGGGDSRGGFARASRSASGSSGGGIISVPTRSAAPSAPAASAPSSPSGGGGEGARAGSRGGRQ
jgi:hypothetical protein